MKINDIARLANVSKSAVSLALNGKNGVSKETRAKIIKIAGDNGYIPRPIIKSDYLQSKSKFLRFVACTNKGIVTEQYESLPFFTELINNIEQQISSKGYSLIVSSIHLEDLEEEIIRLENEQKSLGILLLGTNLTPEHIQMIQRTQSNLVVLDTCFETLNVNFVVMNNILGSYQAGKYLIESGHKHIGYVESLTRMYNFDMRKRGFMQVLDENKIALDQNNIYQLSPTIISSQETFIEKIIKNKDNLPTAIFCEADYMAISVIKSLHELNIKVPEEVSVIGFDNIFESQVITPELTTVNVKKDKIASLAIEKIIKDIENTDESDKMKAFVDTEMIVRNSCKSIN